MSNNNDNKSVKNDDLDLDPFNMDGDVKIAVPDFLNILQNRYDQRAKNPPIKNFFVKSSNYVGSTSKDHAILSCNFQVVVLIDGWNCCELLPSSIALEDYSISFIPDPNATFETSVAQKVSTSSKSSYAYVGVFSQKHSLICSRRGLYSVELNTAVPYASTENKYVSVKIPYAAVNTLKFTVDDSDLDIKVDPSIQSTQTNGTDTAETTVNCVFPPSSSLTIQWTKKIKTIEEEEEEEKEAPKLPLTVTSEQHVLHSIAEKIISTSSVFNYSILNGTVTSLSIGVNSFGKNIRILRVEGVGIKKWEINEDDDSIADENSVASDRDESDVDSIVDEPEPVAPQISAQGHKYDKTIQVWFKYGMEGTYRLQIQSELEMDDVSCQVALPAFSSYGRNISRDIGYVGVEARTNVEVNEIATKMLGKLDSAELPYELRSRASNAIIYGYKYLARGHQLRLDIKKHQDVAVLAMCVDEAHYTITYAEGFLFHRYLLKINNTQKQYLRMTLPSAGCQIWSTRVANAGVKPALDDKQLLIPLKKNSSSSSTEFNVEIVLLAPSVQLKDYGKLSVTFPVFDAPINHLFVSLYVPSDFKYGEFTGGINETKYFSRTPNVTASSSSTFNNFESQMNSNIYIPQQQMQQQIVSQVSHSNSNYMEQINMDYEDDEAGFMGTSSGKSSAVGVMPVRIDAIDIGKQFFFEKVLLVKDEAISISVEFQEQKKPFFQRRRTYNLKGLIFTSVSAAVSVGVSAIMYSFAHRRNWI